MNIEARLLLQKQALSISKLTSLARATTAVVAFSIVDWLQVESTFLSYLCASRVT